MEKILEILEKVCGKPIYRAICLDESGREVVRPVYKLPERMVIRKK